MMRVGYDIDGVGHIFSAGFKDHLDHTGLGHLWKSGPNADPYWDWYKDYGWTDQQFVEFCNEAADDGCLFTGHVRPGYVESIGKVAEAGHEIIIITDRTFGSTPLVSENLTLDWLNENEIEYDELVFSADKTVVWTDVFIDDKISNYDELCSAGTNAFLLNQAWNQVESPDYRKRLDSIDDYTRMILKYGDKLAPRRVYASS